MHLRCTNSDIPELSISISKCWVQAYHQSFYRITFSCWFGQLNAITLLSWARFPQDWGTEGGRLCHWERSPPYNDKRVGERKYWFLFSRAHALHTAGISFCQGQAKPGLRTLDRTKSVLSGSKTWSFDYKARHSLHIIAERSRKVREPVFTGLPSPLLSNLPSSSLQILSLAVA